MWEITSGFPSLSAHVLVDKQCNCHDVARALKQLLHERFDIDHTTLQVDRETVQLLWIETAEQSRPANTAGD